MSIELNITCHDTGNFFRFGHADFSGFGTLPIRFPQSVTEEHFFKENKKIHKILEEAANLLEEVKKIRAQAKALLEQAEEKSSKNAL